MSYLSLLSFLTWISGQCEQCGEAAGTTAHDNHFTLVHKPFVDLHIKKMHVSEERARPIKTERKRKGEDTHAHSHTYEE